jgi:hypothetical protein
LSRNFSGCPQQHLAHLEANFTKSVGREVHYVELATTHATGSTMHVPRSHIAIVAGSVAIAVRAFTTSPARADELPSTDAPAQALSRPAPAEPPQAGPVQFSAPHYPSTEPPPPPAAAPPPPGTFVSGDWSFAFHGIAGVSLYAQDTPAFLLNGQALLLPLSKPASGVTTGADVRQTRLNFSVSGPHLLGDATPKALIEMDLFGGDGDGSYGEVNILPRLRLAYAELSWHHDVLRFGQDHEIVGGIVPESIGHLAFPITSPAGYVGWREPGIGYFHTFDTGQRSQLEAGVQVVRSDWNGPVGFGQTTLNQLNVDYGQLSGWPGVEGRVRWISDALTAYVGVHYSRVAGTHAGGLTNPPTILNAQGATVPAIPARDWDVFAAQVGLRLSVGPLTVMGGGYVGQNTAPLLGELFQFVQTNDVKEWGAWGQVLIAITGSLDISALAGTTQLQTSDVERAGGGRSANSLVGGMLRYHEHGFAIGPEYFQAIARKIDANGNGAPAGAGAPNGDIQANQAMFSAMYIF